MKAPLIIWNHRWEYDKNPETFFQLLFDLEANGYHYEVAILGERYNKYPKVFDEAKQRLGEKVVRFGYVETKEAYKKWLLKADIIPVTSNQDFFGESLVKAMYYNCYPLVPNRLVFPEHFPENTSVDFVYTSYSDLLKKMEHLIENIEITRTTKVSSLVEKYSWSNIAEHYDNTFENMI